MLQRYFDFFFFFFFGGGGGHPFSTYAKIFEKVTFLPSEEAHGACSVSIIDFELWRGDRSKRSHCSFQSLLLVRDHLFSTYSKLSKKLSFLTSSEHFAYI